MLPPKQMDGQANPDCCGVPAPDLSGTAKYHEHPFTLSIIFSPMFIPHSSPPPYLPTSVPLITFPLDLISLPTSPHCSLMSFIIPLLHDPLLYPPQHTHINHGTNAKGFKIAHFNVRSLWLKIDSLNLWLADQDLDIVTSGY